MPVYDFATKGCSDGLTPGGVNSNESMLSFLLSLLCVVESYTANERTGDEDFFLKAGTKAPDEMKKATIKDIVGKPKAQSHDTTIEKSG